ncbi:MAG: DUF362 domain-containing protein [candidate division Zixibacteria bacterium]|nr:DUF362 domain-containing protein [candidate division Zixibacteria bacterium]
MTLDRFFKSLDRRTFLKVLSFTGLSGLVYPRKLIAQYIPLDIVPIIVVEDDTATDLYEINSETVQIMMDTAITAFTQVQDPGEAWKSIFPGITATSIIAIKVNTLFTSIPTHPEVTYAVCEGLKLMDFDGESFPENNIIIYDEQSYRLSQSGYEVNTSDEGIRCYGNNEAGYSTEYYNVAGRNQRISRIITESADYLINIPVLKNHSIAGVTLALKNHYGTCNAPGQLHGNYCDPYVPALNALPVINDKQCLNICDALYGIRSGGPGGYPQFIANRIIMSQDIVAGDCVGRDLLEENGCNTIWMATHIDTAATDYDLGTNDPDEMDITHIINPTTGIDDNNPSLPNQFKLRQNFPNPFNSETRVQFYVPNSTETSLRIFNIQGQSVRVLVEKTTPAGWHNITWNGRDDSGNMVASGVYLCRMQAERFNKSIILEFLK